MAANMSPWRQDRTFSALVSRHLVLVMARLGKYRARLLRFGVPGFMFWVALAGLAQDLDSNITSENRKPGKIADEIHDKAERTAFLALYAKRDPKEVLASARAFLRQFPESAFLTQAFEIAARSSFDEGDYKGGLEYAAQSLALLPENPLLLVA